jgi:hypothetical protein
MDENPIERFEILTESEPFPRIQQIKLKKHQGEFLLNLQKSVNNSKNAILEYPSHSIMLNLIVETVLGIIENHKKIGKPIRFILCFPEQKEKKEAMKIITQLNNQFFPNLNLSYTLNKPNDFTSIQISDIRLITHTDLLFPHFKSSLNLKIGSGDIVIVDKINELFQTNKEILKFKLKLSDLNQFNLWAKEMETHFSRKIELKKKEKKISILRKNLEALIQIFSKILSNKEDSVFLGNGENVLKFIEALLPSFKLSRNLERTGANDEQKVKELRQQILKFQVLLKKARNDLKEDIITRIKKVLQVFYCIIQSRSKFHLLKHFSYEFIPSPNPNDKDLSLKFYLSNPHCLLEELEGSSAKSLIFLSEGPIEGDFHLKSGAELRLKRRTKLGFRSERVLFFPSEESRDQLYSILRSASKSIDICMFYLTDKDIFDILLNKQIKEIKIRILLNEILDNSKQKLKFFNEVKVNNGSIMHHKFAIIDDKILVNGSLNFTNLAIKGTNLENTLIIYNKRIVKAFRKEFKKLWVQIKSFAAF